MRVTPKEHPGRRRRSEKHYAGHEGQQQREQGGPGLAPNGTEQAFRAPATDTFDCKKIVYSFIAVYALNRLPGYKIAAPGALARAKVKLYHGKAPCGRYHQLVLSALHTIARYMPHRLVHDW